MDVKTILGSNIKRHRKRLALSQGDFSEILDISLNHLSNIELGQSFISANLLELIYKKFSITPSELMFSLEHDKINKKKIKETISDLEIGIEKIKTLTGISE